VSEKLADALALTDQEIDRVLLLFAYTRKDAGFTEEEAQKVANWIVQARLHGALADGVLSGELLPDWKDDEIAFAPRAAFPELSRTVCSE